MRCALLLTTLLLAMAHAAGMPAWAQQDTTVFFINADTVEDRLVRLPTQWAYHPDHDTPFAAPDVNDTPWTRVDTRLLPNTPLPPLWNGTGWFRLTIQVDPTLVNRPIGLRLNQRGATTLYLDGRLLYSFGAPAATAVLEQPALRPEPVALVLSDSLPHVLTVRYSNQNARALQAVNYEAGFSWQIGDLSALMSLHTKTTRSATMAQVGLTGMYLVFGLLHLFFFIFYPPIRENLYFSIVALCIALILFNNYQESFFATHAGQLIFIRRLWSPLSLLTMYAFLRFMYIVYREKAPRHFYVLVGVAVLVGCWGWFNPNLGWAAPAGGRTYAYAVALVFEAEILRSLFVKTIIRRQRPGIIDLGFLAFVAAFTYPLLVVLGFVPPFLDLLLFPNLVITILLLSTSIYLSRSFAQTNITLKNKLEEVTRLSEQKLAQERQIRKQELDRALLEAEYEQKLKELEEARALQISMLPQTVPTHPRLALAAYMQTATEVGGDYYDFHTADNGTLTVAIGDATGHGMKAGTMVTATKSLFKALGHDANLLRTFDRSSRALKEMNLRQLYMALTLAKFEGDRFRLATAGMPPTLVFRAATNHVEVVRLKGMPLGSFVDFPYREETLDLAPGDTILFMSDGFPELFNAEHEMLGYDRAVEVFASVAHQAPETIIVHLVDLGHTWTGDRPPDDDITFVVIKVRAHGQEERVSEG